jgi:hypothetical protein
MFFLCELQVHLCFVVFYTPPLGGGYGSLHPLGEGGCVGVGVGVGVGVVSVCAPRVSTLELQMLGTNK